MAQGHNQVELIGHLGKDPELRYSQSGVAVCNASLATGERIKKDGEWVPHTEWHRLVLFGKSAENLSRYCKKGRQIFVQGRLRTRTWPHKEHQEVTCYATEVLVGMWIMLGPREQAAQEGDQRRGDWSKPAASAPAAGAQGGNQGTGRPQGQQGGGGGGQYFDDDDDLPF